ncbi:tetratricopeptide repeat protein [Alkaliphilus transvaalensis]|uniref:tetratricopeptide repeat protein n=1 Tax=Alkaliphilus transvaalensis TaxID=114628 RepID=UPI0005561C04|nr:tetratricopeptide repeat protein [Alkaliphilus transvaalensis]
MSLLFKIKERKKIIEIYDLLRSNRNEEVTKECSILLEKYPREKHIFQLQYIALIQSEKFDEALNYLKRVMDFKPNKETNFQIASLLCNEHFKRYEEAIDILDNLISKEMRNADLYLSKGVALACLKRYKEAEECYNKALQLKPTNLYWIYVNKAVIKLNVAEFQEALDLCNMAVKNNRNLENLDYLYITKARIYSKLSNEDLSTEYLKKAAQLHEIWKQKYYECDELKRFGDCL